AGGGTCATPGPSLDNGSRGSLALLGPDGEVAEWSIAPHSKCGIRATVSGVQIPPSPPTCSSRTEFHLQEIDELRRLRRQTSRLGHIGAHPFRRQRSFLEYRLKSPL